MALSATALSGPRGRVVSLAAIRHKFRLCKQSSRRQALRDLDDAVVVQEARRCVLEQDLEEPSPNTFVGISLLKDSKEPRDLEEEVLVRSHFADNHVVQDPSQLHQRIRTRRKQFGDAAEEATVGSDVGVDSPRSHVSRQLHQQFPHVPLILLGMGESCVAGKEGVVADDVGFHTSSSHLLKHAPSVVHCRSWGPGDHVEQCVEGHEVGFHTTLLHVCYQFMRLPQHSWIVSCSLGQRPQS
mmetsp:Transcript_35081/g.75892  ORF Transcript_35081/g.75892 Transcript_35081/m.75892 type:complete len:241 (+) Transcript_35081:444-1166(+)